MIDLEECDVPTQVVSAGSDVILFCLARGTGPQIVWMRGDQVLETGGRVAILDLGMRLRISRIRPSDSDIYNCTATNNNNNIITFIDSYVQRVDVQSRPPTLYLLVCIHFFFFFC